MVVEIVRVLFLWLGMFDLALLALFSTASFMYYLLILLSFLLLISMCECVWG